IAGLRRALGRGIDTSAWVWLAEGAGQRLFYPPNVAGWDDTRWLDTATFRARWEIAAYAIRPRVLKDNAKHVPHDPHKLLHRAEAVFGHPTLTGHTEATLTRFAKRAMADANADWKKRSYPPLVENALRQLLATAPDLQTC
ncbi:MAG: DUF1800 family protein, partial [Gaiellaceae bacterium]